MSYLFRLHSVFFQTWPKTPLVISAGNLSNFVAKRVWVPSLAERIADLRHLVNLRLFNWRAPALTSFKKPANDPGHPYPGAGSSSSGVEMGLDWLLLHILYARGTCQKHFSGFCPLRGYPPPHTSDPLTENQCEKKKDCFLSGIGG